MRALRAAGWALLGAFTLAGLALSLVALLAELPATRPLVARAVIGAASARIAGRLELEGIAVLPQGGLELHRLRVFDPDGHLVLAVGRARISADATALRSRRVGVAIELDHPSVLLEEERDGGVSIGRAFEPRRSHAEGPPGRAGPAGGAPSGAGFTVQITRLELREGDVWWVDRDGNTRLEASGIDVVARGTLSAARMRAELRLRGELAAPIQTPVALEVVAALTGSALRVPLLKVDAADSAVSLAGEVDLVRRAGRVLVERLGVSRARALALFPTAPDGADLAADGYAESDGTTLSAAVRLEGASGRGGADAAAAARLDAPARAAGFDVALDGLDPARLVASWPSGEVTLTARGALAGTAPSDLRGDLALSVGRTRIGAGAITRAEVVLRAARGALQVERLSAAAPGLAVRGAGRWARTGPIEGNAAVEVSDLAAATRNVAALAGRARPPPASGRLRADATLAGTADAPALGASLVAPSLGWGALTAERVRLSVRAVGPRRAPGLAVDAAVGVLRQGAAERARTLTLRASLSTGSEATLSARALVPEAAGKPASLDARGRLDRRRATFSLSELALAVPGGTWTLARPAALALRGPSVDRLELVEGAQRIVVEGGIEPRGALAARVELSAIDLTRLPPPLRPGADVRGLVSGHVDLRGTTAHPVAAGRVAVEQGAFERLVGLTAVVDGRWDGGARRAAGTLSLAREAGGAVDAELDLPLPLAGRDGEPVRARARGAALPLRELLEAAGSDLPAAGTAAVELRVAGTAGAPALAGEVSIRDGAWADLDGLGLTVTLDAPGATARAHASVTLAGRSVAAGEATAPLDLGDLATAPRRALHALRTAPLRGKVAVLALNLSALSGRAGVPPSLEGVLSGEAEVTGSLAAPRARATVEVTGGGWRDVRRVVAHAEASADASGLALSLRAAVGGEEALRVEASLGLAPERLGDRAALRAARVEGDAIVPRLDAGRAFPGVAPLAGTVEAHLALSGTAGAPVLAVEVEGNEVAIEGRPLGDAAATLRWAAGRANAEATLRPRAGGTLHATLALEAALGIDAPGPSLREAPAEATVVAKALDLGFLPAAARGTFRSAAGKVDLDLRAAGPLARLSPRGTVHVAGGGIAIAELGEWTDLALDAKVTDDAVELSRLEVRRGKGRLSANGALRGLSSPDARLKAAVSASSLPLTSAGMALATVTVEATATGSYRDGALDVELRVPRGLVWLPSKPPRNLQSTEVRRDVVVGRRAERKAGEREANAASGAAPAPAPARPVALRLHAVVPKGLFVKSDDPR